MSRLRSHSEVMNSLKEEKLEYYEAITAAEIVNKLVDKVMQARLRKEISQKELDKLAGLKKNTVRDFEASKNLSISTLVRITRVLGMEVIVKDKEKTRHEVKQEWYRNKQESIKEWQEWKKKQEEKENEK